MKRRCLPPIIVLVMLLASLFSTETTEVWCRVVVGAAIDADDDDGPYFTFRQSTDIAQAGRLACPRSACRSFLVFSRRLLSSR